MMDEKRVGAVHEPPLRDWPFFGNDREKNLPSFFGDHQTYGRRVGI
jgi:hypothetical protein